MGKEGLSPPISKLLLYPETKMKLVLAIFFCALGLSAGLPTQTAQSSVVDLIKYLEGFVGEEGHLLLSKLANVIHHVEESLIRVTEYVPRTFEKIHREANEVIDELKKVTLEIQQLLQRKNAYRGFDLLSGLTELSGGTKLSTALHLLMLADKAHRVMEDAKEFVPHLEGTLKKMQKRVEDHVNVFASHVLKELGLQDGPAQSVAKKIEELFEKVQEEGHVLILDLLHKMEHTFDILEEKLPSEYERVKESVLEIRSRIHELVQEIEKTLIFRSFNLLDIAGDLSGGTSLSTVFKVMSLVDKFNTVVQDVKNFGPKAEVFLQHSVKKVAESAQVFFTHASNKLLE